MIKKGTLFSGIIGGLCLGMAVASASLLPVHAAEEEDHTAGVSMGKEADEEISTYYEKNKELFHTEHPFVKGLFIKVPLHSQDLASVRKWYKKNNRDAIESLEKYSLRNAVSYDYFYDRWMPLSDIAVKIPLKALDTDENYLDKNRNIEVKDTAFCYFLHVEEFLGKDQQRPLDFAKTEIKEILINLKRVEFINKVKEELYRHASDRNKINYYYLNSNE